MNLKLWVYFILSVLFCVLPVSASNTALPIQGHEPSYTIEKILKTDKKRKKGGWQERMRQRIHKLLKAHDAFLIAFLICLFLLALSLMLGIHWIKNLEVLNALNYVSIGLIIVTAFFGILWLMTVNMRRHP